MHVSCMYDMPCMRTWSYGHIGAKIICIADTRNRTGIYTATTCCTDRYTMSARVTSIASLKDSCHR